MLNSKNNSNPGQGEGQAFDQEVVEAFASLFKGRTDSHGRIEVCVYEPVTLKHYKKYLKAEVNPGIYFLLDDSTCHFFGIDLDEKDFNKAKAIRDELVKNNIPAYIAESKSKGLHIYGFALERFKAVDIRRVLHYILKKLNIKCEIFPKQDYHQPDDPDDKKHPGSYINLPCFGYTRPFLSGDMHEVKLGVALQRIKFVSQESIERVLQTLPKEKPLEPKKVVGRRKEHPPCLESIFQGVSEQQREDAALALARHYLIQFYKPGEVFWLLQDYRLVHETKKEGFEGPGIKGLASQYKVNYMDKIHIVCHMTYPRSRFKDRGKTILEVGNE